MNNYTSLFPYFHPLPCNQTAPFVNLFVQQGQSGKHVKFRFGVLPVAVNSKETGTRFAATSAPARARPRSRYERTCARSETNGTAFGLTELNAVKAFSLESFIPQKRKSPILKILSAAKSKIIKISRWRFSLKGRDLFSGDRTKDGGAVGAVIWTDPI